MPKISELDYGQVIGGNEILPIVQSSETKKVTAQSLLTKPIFEISLEDDNYTISQYGTYIITYATNESFPYMIFLLDPTTVLGMELLLLNYDQTQSAQFDSIYVPQLEASTDPADKLTNLGAKQAVKLIAVNGYWSALSFRFP